VNRDTSSIIRLCSDKSLSNTHDQNTLLTYEMLLHKVLLSHRILRVFWTSTVYTVDKGQGSGKAYAESPDHFQALSIAAGADARGAKPERVLLLRCLIIQSG
jgi:hypothetical protein